MSIHTLTIFSTQQHHYLGLQWGRYSYQVAACLSQYIWAGICLSVCLKLIYPSYIFTHSCCQSATHLSPPITQPAPQHHRLSTICCHCDQSPFHRTSHLTEMACSKAIPYLVQMNSLDNLWNLLPRCPSSMSLSLCLLHRCTSSLPPTPIVCLFSNWSHISSTVWFLSLLAQCSLSSFYLFLSPSGPPPHTHTHYIYLPPTRPVATTVLLQFMGSLQQLPMVEVEEKSNVRDNSGRDMGKWGSGEKIKKNY